jgi:acetylornithine deacetylase
LCEAFSAVTGDCKPYSITGSLPCIRDLQEAGFDVQTLGFGKLAAYHSNNGEQGGEGGGEGGCLLLV